MHAQIQRAPQSLVAAFAAGAVVAVLAGLIGLGGAEFRLPLLIAVFGFAGLHAVVLNKATSLVVVAVSLVFRGYAVPFAAVASQWPVIVNLLAGSVVGAWLGADAATRMRQPTLYKVIAAALILIAAVLVFAHDGQQREAALDGLALVAAGVAAGLVIGVVASVLGVAGGELLIPTLVLLFGVDVKLAGSLSLAISLPTMLVGFARYSRDDSFAVLGTHRRFWLAMAAGSVVGAAVGALLLGVVPSAWLVPVLALVLVASAVKLSRHR